MRWTRMRFKEWNSFIFSFKSVKDFKLFILKGFFLQFKTIHLKKVYFKKYVQKFINIYGLFLKHLIRNEFKKKRRKIKSFCIMPYMKI